MACTWRAAGGCAGGMIESKLLSSSGTQALHRRKASAGSMQDDVHTIRSIASGHPLDAPWGSAINTS